MLIRSSPAAMIRPALVGVAATMVMTVPILAARRIGLFRTPPPVEISRNVARTAAPEMETHGPGFALLWKLAHLAYGAFGALLFQVARPVLPDSSLRAGSLFGLGVWAAGYLGYLPRTGLYPAPAHDRTTRTGTMIVAHLVYGIVVAAGMRALDRSGADCHAPESMAQQGRLPAG